MCPFTTKSDAEPLASHRATCLQEGVALGYSTFGEGPPDRRTAVRLVDSRAAAMAATRSERDLSRVPISAANSLDTSAAGGSCSEAMLVAANPARALGALAVAVSLLAVASCATLRPLDLSAGPPVLKEGEGILFIHVSTELPIQSIETTAGEVAAGLGAGEHLQLLVVPSGTYHWTRLTRLRRGVTLWYRPNVDAEQLAFTVRPGVINYPGLVKAMRFSADPSRPWARAPIGILPGNRSR